MRNRIQWGRLLSLTLATLLIGLTALALRVQFEQTRLAAQLIRLHVVASSDDPADQARKLRVRDALLPEIAALTTGCTDADAAEAALRSGLPHLRLTAFDALGTGESVRAGLADEVFPRRDYPTFSLPAGTYRALRIVLGAGEGHNWWCVAFPALCLPAAAELEEENGPADAHEDDFEAAAQAVGLTEGQIALMTSDRPDVQFKFRILDWLSALFSP